MNGQIIDPKTGQPMVMDGVKNIVGDDELRAKQAAEEIRVILEAYDAELFPVIMLSPKGVVGTSVDVMPKSRLRPPSAAGPISADPVISGDPKITETEGTQENEHPTPLNRQVDAPDESTTEPTPATPTDGFREVKAGGSGDDAASGADVIDLDARKGNFNDNEDTVAPEHD